jgi:hypothetical protein
MAESRSRTFLRFVVEKVQVANLWSYVFQLCDGHWLSCRIVKRAKVPRGQPLALTFREKLYPDVKSGFADQDMEVGPWIQCGARLNLGASEGRNQGKKFNLPTFKIDLLEFSKMPFNVGPSATL